MQGPLVSKGADVTPEIIQKALQGDPAISSQNCVSLPAVQRYVDRLIKGDVAPPIKRTYFPKKGSDTKAFEGNVPQSVLDSLGLK
ncbi:hypothetical protein VRB67_00795 [Pseudomonas trivialis]|uniref:hypothetical protein n=1 Tax=Pseudomonas trivialis TaxID=200450 RepID=UPI0030D5D882